MTKYLIVDTEGSGLFDYSKPADADGQPRLAHLGLILVDESLAIEREISILVRPDGWVMTEGATAVNGLTTEYLLEHGQPVAEALDAYEAAIGEGRAMVAYGAQHDAKQLRGEFRRAGRDDLFEQTPNLCMMRVMNGVCKLTAEGSNRRKFPKLVEALAHFHRQPTAAHTAMGDARDCLWLFRKGIELNLNMTPEVHRAKAGTKAGEAAGLGPSKSTQRKARKPKLDPVDEEFTEQPREQRLNLRAPSDTDEIPE